MITLSTTPKAACSLSCAEANIDIFPESALEGRWALFAHPQEELKDKIISWPGEYDFSGITVMAIGQEQGRQISYSVTMEGVRVGFVDAPVMDWPDTDLQNIGDIDVLVVAATDPKKVLALVESMDPRIVVLFKAKDGDLPAVAKALGLATVEPVEELKIKAGSLPTEARQVVVLK